MTHSTSRLSCVMKAIDEKPLTFKHQPVICSLDGKQNGCTYKIAKTEQDYISAWQLVYQVYLNQGYIRETFRKLWYSHYERQPSTMTLNAYNTDQITATVTLLFDSSFGLPADTLYPELVQSLRNRGRRLCELSSLVNIEKNIHTGIDTVKHLFRLAYLTANYLEQITDLIITVNPKHSKFYQKVLLLEKIGEEKRYDKVQGAPAHFLRLNLEHARERYRNHYGSRDHQGNLYRYMTDNQENFIHWLKTNRKSKDQTTLFRHFTLNVSPSEQLQKIK